MQFHKVIFISLLVLDSFSLTFFGNVSKQILEPSANKSAVSRVSVFRSNLDFYLVNDVLAIALDGTFL